MYLRQVEAVRYGELSEGVLGPFGGGLNVVVGRNEAGKSTFTSLVRHVLFGFPRGRTNERLYQPSSGDQRVGRLVFSDDGVEWVVERMEGAHGGDATVYGPSGAEPGEVFLDPLKTGVSAGVFRTVFGFSLEELSDMSSLADIQSRLYATTAGLGVNPHDVLEKIRSLADEVWAPRARTRRIHTLNKELRSIRDERRRLEAVAERYRTDREHRSVVARELEAADTALGAARAQEERLAAMLAEGRRLDERIRADEEAADEHKLAAERAKREAEAFEIDESLMARAEAVERLGARCELFRAEAEQLHRDEERAREVEADLQRRVADMGDGWTMESAMALHLDLELENRLYEEGELIREARRERDENVRRASEAHAEHDEALRDAQKAVAESELGEDDITADVIGVRLLTIDRLLALQSASQTRDVSLFPATAAAVISVVMAVAGLLVGDSLLAFAAGLPAALAVGLFVRPWLRRRRVPEEVESLLAVIGADTMPAASDLMEMRNSLHACRRLWAAEAQLGRTAAARDTGAQEAVSRFDGAWQNWLSWLEEQRLQTPSNHPESVRRVLRLLRDVRSRAEGHRELQIQIERRRALAAEFVEDALAIGAISENDAPAATFEEVAHGVRSVLARLVTARRAAEKKRDAEAAIIAAEEKANTEANRATEAKRKLDRLIKDSGVRNHTSLADLEAALAVARRQAREIEGERSEFLENRGTLDGRLQRGADESASARLRLDAAGVIERIGHCLETYAVSSVAARLLEDSLEAYEAERQPAVIQRAQEIFSNLTGGRYTRLATPLGRFEPSVSGASSSGKAPEHLSRATAEQLFLALRLSYLENLAGAHTALPVLMDDVLVNFDDERRRAAVGAIADFARNRQVVFFTCHPATAEAFMETAGEHTTLELG